MSLLCRENGPSNPTAPISAGFYRLDPGSPLVYTYTYDEMKIIVDGDFEISDESGQSIKAAKGDGMFLVLLCCPVLEGKGENVR